MKSCPMSGVQPPYELPSDTMYFHDWRYVDHGYIRYLDADGLAPPLMPNDSLPPVLGDAEWLPRGVRIETIPGVADDEPAIRAADIGEMLFFGGTVLREGGMLRLFYESTRPGASDDEVNHDKVLRVAESDDGVNWRYPDLGRMEIPGEKHRNAVFDPGRVGYHGGGVFVDSSAGADERYKAVWLGYASRAALERYRNQWPDDVDPMAVLKPEDKRHSESSAAFALFGAVSPDGLRWTMLEEPLLIQHSDTFNACTYNATLGKYVMYPRTWYYGRRTVGVATSEDFRHFSGLRQVLWPDGGMGATETWYTPGYTKMPGSDEYHLLFATRWSQVDDTFSPILHAGPDGMVFNRVPGPPMLDHGPTGSWYACGAAVISLVELGPDQMGSMVMGWHVPHKRPRVFPGFGQCGWVRWKRGRVSALCADEDACFSTHAIKPRGRRLVLNYRAKQAGFIRVGVFGVREHHRCADCDWLTGDELDRVVTWGGQSDLGRAGDEPIRLRFELRAAQLFSVRFE